MKRITILLYLLFLSQLVHAQPGYLDKTFGDSGVAVFRSDAVNFFPYDMKVLPDSKIIHCGLQTYDWMYYSIYVARHHQNGSVDSSFGVNGYCSYMSYYGFERMKMYVCNDGKMLVYGGQTISGFSWYMPSIVRFLPTGQLDSSFGENGVFIDTISNNGGFYSRVNVDPSGNIIALGGEIMLPEPNVFHPTITKLMPNGTPDKTFGKDGYMVIGSSSDTGQIYDAMFYGDDRCVVSISMPWPNTNSGGVHLLCTNFQGVIDSSFGHNGVVNYQFSDGDDHVSSMVEDDKGRLICSVDARDGPYIVTLLVRYMSDGSIDKSFGDRGVSKPFVAYQPDIPTFCALDSNQNVIEAGQVESSNTVKSFATSRYHGNGEIDSSYGLGGISMDIPTSMTYINALDVQQDGKYLLAGYNWNDGKSYTIIIRINSEGTYNVSTAAATSSPLSLHPTPSLDNCTLTYTLPASGECSITLRDESGRGVRTFAASEYRIAGKHEEELDLRGLAAGVYFLQIESSGTIQTAKLIKQ